MRLRRGLAGLLAAVSLSAAAAPDRTLLESAGALTGGYNDDGLLVRAFGVPVINGSRLLVFRADRTHDLFYFDDDQPNMVRNAIVEPLPGGRRITIMQRIGPGREGPFCATETLTLSNDNRAILRLEYELRGTTVAGNMDWSIAGLDATPLAGMRYEMTNTSGTSTGVLPDETAPFGGAGERLAAGVTSLSVSSRLGPVSIKADHADNDLTLEYRRRKWEVGGPRLFWLTLRKPGLTDGTTGALEISFTFPQSPAGAARTTADATADVVVAPLDKARYPWTPWDRVIPTPKHIERTSDSLPLSAGARIVTAAGSPDDIVKAAGQLQRALTEYGATDIGLSHGDSEGTAPCIRVGLPQDFPAELTRLAQLGAAIPENPEGYCLLVTNEEAILIGWTPLAVRHGVETLLQLIEGTPSGIALRGARISDFPSLAWRGSHFHTGRGRGAEIARFVDRILARHKITNFVWECQYINWDSQPDIHQPRYGMTKDEARLVVETARARGVDIIPLIPSLGHAEWIFANEKNLDIAEDPDRPYAYAPGVERTYEFIFEVYREAIELFRPSVFHIGHDEFTMRGRFPHRSSHTGKDDGELFIEDTRRLHDWLTKQGLKTMMWGDMLIHSSEASDAGLAPSVAEARKRREQIPSDIMIADWHYGGFAPDKFKSLAILRDAGYPVIGCGWFDPVNIRNLSRACADAGVPGYLQTTWAGFNFAIAGNQAKWLQYWAHVLAAEQAWTGGNSEAPISARERFLDAWHDRKPVAEQRPGVALDLRPIFNVSRTEDGVGRTFVGAGQGFDLSALPAGALAASGTTYDIATNDAGLGAVLLAGPMNPAGAWPRRAALAIKPAPARDIRFLICAAYPVDDGVRAGSIELRYADGSIDTVPLVYGENLFAWNDYRMSDTTSHAWRGKAATDAPVALWEVCWTNTKPASPVAAITMTSAGTAAAPILVAATLIPPDAP